MLCVGLLNCYQSLQPGLRGRLGTVYYQPHTSYITSRKALYLRKFANQSGGIQSLSEMIVAY